MCYTDSVMNHIKIILTVNFVPVLGVRYLHMTLTDL